MRVRREHVRGAVRRAVLWRAAAVVAVLVLAIGAVAGRNTMRKHQTAAASAPRLDAPASKPLPKLVDLGADKCIPCKAMAPILDQLRDDFRGRLDVVFLDVWKNPHAGREHGVRIIPTQIFFDPSGKELLRHQGFISREEILAIWRELGFDFTATASPAAEEN